MNFQIEVGENIVVTAPAKAGMAIGDPSITSVRPERITVYASTDGAPQDCPNVLNGTVKSAIFLGPFVRYHVLLANGQTIIADKTAAESQGEFKINEQVLVGWETENSVVLPA
jgi:ABC-type Fe3+/spermidine/putrescine transport system ATPase subunit